MLLVINSLRALDFDSLMNVYSDTNRHTGAQRWRWESPEHQIEFAEQAFYDYLHDVFFTTPGAIYSVWVEEGRYVSALRLEPYKDGLLLAGLETAPDCRGRGYASALIESALKNVSLRVYSHIDKRNEESLRVHRKCGFSLLRDSAVLLDGTVSSQAYTLLWESSEKNA